MYADAVFATLILMNVYGFEGPVGVGRVSAGALAESMHVGDSGCGFR